MLKLIASQYLPQYKTTFTLILFYFHFYNIQFCYVVVMML